LVLAAAAAALCSNRLATAQGWIAGDGNWSDPANWSTDTVPSDGDSVEINSGVAAAFTVNYDYTGPEVELTQVELDSGSRTQVATLSLAANNISAISDQGAH
jgi:hypothetical protein